MEMTCELTAGESARLEQYEEIVRAGIDTFFDVGSALKSIRDEKLYRLTHKTFEDYCRAKWALGRHYAYHLIKAVEVTEDLRASGCDQLPQNESQARPLAVVPAEWRSAVWSKALATADGDRPTRSSIEAAVKEWSESQSFDSREHHADVTPFHESRWVYFIQMDGTDFIKIGPTTSVERILFEGQTWSPLPLVELGRVDERKFLAKKVADMFETHRFRGDWFRMSEEISQFLQEHAFNAE